MQSINYDAFLSKDVAYRRVSRLPWHALIVSCVIAGALIGLAVLLASMFRSTDDVLTLLVVVLFGVLVVLVGRMFQAAQSKRDALLRAFAADNGFSYRSVRPRYGLGSAPEYISNASLLSPVNRLGYRVWATADMSLSGTYRGLAFDIRVVLLSRTYASVTSGGALYFGVIAVSIPVVPDDLHLVALPKSDRFFNGLNTEAINRPEWQPALIGWQADAEYDTFVEVHGGVAPVVPEGLAAMLADLRRIDESSLEINGSDCYILTADGISYTREGMMAVFDKLDVVAVRAEQLA